MDSNVTVMNGEDTTNTPFDLVIEVTVFCTDSSVVEGEAESDPSSMGLGWSAVEGANIVDSDSLISCAPAINFTAKESAELYV